METQMNFSEITQEIVKIGMENYIHELLNNEQLKLEMIECSHGYADVVGGLAAAGIEDIGMLLELDKNLTTSYIVEKTGYEPWSDDFLTLCNIIMDEYLREIEMFNNKNLKKL